MRLDERNWVLSAGLTPEWEQVHRRRRDQALASLKLIAAAYKRKAPAAVRKDGFDRGLAVILADRTPLRDRVLTDPAFDYWLHLWDKHFGMPSGEDNWRLQFGLVQGFAATLALAGRRPARLTATLDPEAHLHLYGAPHRFEFPGDLGLQTVALEIGRGAVSVSGPGGLRARFPSSLFFRSRAFRESAGPVTWAREREIGEGIHAQSCGLLITQGVIMHGLASPTPKEMDDFADSLTVALDHVRERAPGLYAEMTDLVRVLVPLVNPQKFGSVSSSYVNLRGMIALSHDWDPLLQAETLIHEFCHQKMNQLLLADPILLPGQSGQVFYSPWRKDARRLRGLILGAHAFLNVAHYLVRSLSREEYRLKQKVAVMCNVARRLCEVESATQSACAYGSFTDFGSQFVLGLWRELQSLKHAVQFFPPALLKEARLAHKAHRDEFCLPLTGIHRCAGFVPKVRAIPFGQKRIIRRRKPELAGAKK